MRGRQLWPGGRVASRVILLVAAVLVMAACESRDPLVSSRTAPSPSGVLAATTPLPREQATPFPLAATAALPTAEAAIAAARRLAPGAAGGPAQVVGVRLMTLQDEVADEGAHGFGGSAPHAPSMPVWQLEVVGADLPQPCVAAPTSCALDHVFVVLDGTSGSQLRSWGVGPQPPARPVAANTPAGRGPFLATPPTVPPGARLPTIDAALEAAHGMASGPDGLPARAIAARLLALDQTWEAPRPDLPATTPVWLITLDEAQVDDPCPSFAPRPLCTGTLATFIIDATTGHELAAEIAP